MLKWISLLSLGILILGPICPSVTLAETMDVKYPMFSRSFDEYAVKLLELSLQKANVKFNLHRVTPPLLQERAFFEVKRKGGIDVAWAMTSSAREKELRAIRIPLEKGLIGWRLLLIKKGNEFKFEKIREVSEIKKLLTGQGHDWPDTTILRSNVFDVFDSSSYEGLFQMLKSGRIDFMSRSVLEIWSEVETLQDQGIVVERNLALYYPAPIYFFVHKDNKELGDSIEKGLRRAIKDKSFDKVFHEWVGPLIEKSGLKNRTVFELHNPLLSPETPLENRAYWFQNRK